MNILYSTGMDSEKYGGLERMLVALARELTARGHALFVQYESEPASPIFMEDMRNAGARVVVLPTRQSAVSGFFALCRFIKKEKIDAIHATFSPAKDLCVLAGRVTRVRKMICHYRNISSGKPRTGLRLWMTSHLSDVNLVISEAVKRSIIKAGAPPEKTHVLYNGVCISPELKARDEICASLGLDPSGLVLMSVAWDDPVKGVDLLLEAMRTVVGKVPDVRLWIAGSACGEKNRALAEDLGISGHIDWLGVRDDIPTLMGCCDIYIQPSRSEAFSRTVAEAMAARKPVVAFKVGGLPEVIDDNVTGILAEPENVSSLSGAIIRLATSAELRDRMGEEAARKAARLFDLKREINSVINYYAGTA